MDALVPALAWAPETDGGRASDALLDDLIAFLDDETVSAPADELTSLDSHSDNGSVSSPSRWSPPARPPSAPKRECIKAKRRQSIKRTLDGLRDEAEQLTKTLNALRNGASQTRSSVTEAALTERYKRHRAEKECEQLRDAVYTQAQFLKGLQSVFSAPPSFAVGLNLCRHLHNYTRLPRERSVRWNEYAALSQEARLQRAMDIVCRETQMHTSNERGGFNPTRPLLSTTVHSPAVHSEVINDPRGFGVTSTSVYALETRDIATVARGACVAVRDTLARCSSYQCVNLSGQIVDPEASSSSTTNMLYRVTGVHHKSLSGDSDELSIESRTVTLYKQTDDYAVVLWDYVDEDELHPTTDADITRQAIGICLIRREMCDDGVERSVVRILKTRLYRFHHEHSAAAKLHRFQVLLTTGSGENELLFRSILVDAIAKEQAAHARFLGAMRTKSASFDASCEVGTGRSRYHALQCYYLDSRRRMRTNELLFLDILIEPVASEAGASVFNDVDDDRANDALLRDLFTFLDGEPTAPPDDATSLDSLSDRGTVACPSPYNSSGGASPARTVSPILPSPPLSVPKQKRTKPREGCPIKRTLEALRDEAEQLTNTLHILRSETSKTRSSATQMALTERFKRRRAEKECEQLRDAVYAQAQFLKGLQSVFSAPPSFASGLNLCRHLHHYTRLPRERSVRWNEYAALSQEARLQRAMDIVCRETQELTCNDRDGMDRTKPLLSSTVDMPFVHTEVLSDANGFGVTSTSVYALETRDIASVARGACVAIRDGVARGSSYQCVVLKGQIVDPEVSSSSSANMLYRVMGVHHKSPRADSDELSVESRVLTLYKQTDDQAVVLWDYIDEDELHPTTDADITRQAIGACLIRREMCDDGVERTVCRVLNTRRYRFHEHAASDKLRRFQDFLTTASWENELLFRSILMDSIAKEEAAYARVMGTMRAEKR